MFSTAASTGEIVKLVVIQLSDIHIDLHKDNHVLGKAEAMAAAVFPLLVSADRVMVIVSGDIAYSGEAEQYDAAERFLRDFAARVSAEWGATVEFFVVPGNHDCDFSKESGSRKANIAQIQSGGHAHIDVSVIQTCTEVQTAFFEFQARMHGAAEADPLWFERTINDGERAIVFEGMNVSWVSKTRDLPGMLHFPYERYKDRPCVPVNFHLLVLHHPVNWFSQSIYSGFRGFLRERACVVISGHEHIGGGAEINDIDAGMSVALEGRVLQHHGGSLTDTGFNVVTIDTSSGCYQLARLDYVTGAYVRREEALWSDFRSLQASVRQALPLTDAFKAKISDPGGFFITAGKDLTLNDIYVYPDLLPVRPTGSSQQRVYINSAKLQDLENIEGGVLVEGEEKSGKTSLLYQLFSHYLGAGLIPVLLDGPDMQSAHSLDLDRLIKRAVVQQYGASATTIIEQTSRTKKIVLVDNLDQSEMAAGSARAGILMMLKERFADVVVTVGALFDMGEVLEGDSGARLEDFRHYKLQAFGNVKRSSLIKRWFRLHSDGSVDEGAFIGKCDSAERVLNTVMDTSLIPHVPLHLLTLLQSIGDGRSGELENSSLSSYYEFLLTQALLGAGVKQDKIDDYYQYGSYLAWHFHEHGSGASGSERLLTLQELRTFHQYFRQEFLSIDFDTTMEVLQKARVLQRLGQDFCFRYPYIYYYLKGRFISLEIQNSDEIRTYVANCCDHLYVRDNANTVLFLAHHMSNNVVIDHIARALKLLFADRLPAELAEDAAGVNELIYQAPELVYQGGSPETHRDRRDARADAHAARGGKKDLMADKPELSPTLSLAATLALLIKTSEILGQLLNAQNARIRRQRKHELVKEIYDGNLRALNNFFAMMTENSEPLMAQLRTLLQEKSKDVNQTAGEAFARRFMSQIVEMVSVGLVLRAARNTTSDELGEVVASVVEVNPTLAYRIIELATLLDSPKEIPRKILLALYKASEGNLIALHVIRHLALNRLYMFKTTQQDLFWLRDNLKMDIKATQRISFGRSDTRIA